MAQEQGLTITCEGGLDKTTSSFGLLKTPGAATRLLNFESSIYGGYRRVNGYRKFLSSPVVSITVNDGGSGYTEETTDISIISNDPNGGGAGAYATVVDGVITEIIVFAEGAYYEVPPTVIISGLGTGASATAVLNQATNPDGSTPEVPDQEDGPGPLATFAKIQGMYAHEEGGLAVQEGNLYWSENGYDWIQVNFDYGSCNAGGHTSQYACEVNNNTWTAGFATAAQLATSGVEVGLDEGARYTFTEYTIDTIPIVVLCNGVDPVAYFQTYVDGGTRYFKFRRALYKSFDIAPTVGNYALIPRPQYCETHADHLIVGGWPENVAAFYYSDLYDPTQFDGASAGEVNISDEITGLKVFRKDLIVFARNSIVKFIDINGTPFIQDITRNIGCLDGFSIQEIGGDLVFLAPDGIRTIAATTRIDDVELSSISGNIKSLIADLVKNVDLYQLSSVVIRSKNQYRLFFTNSTISNLQQRGITGTFKISSTGSPMWEWSELRGFNPACMTSGYDVNNVERVYHGDYYGYIHAHDVGNSFDGQNIFAEYKTPDIDYGDIGVRKTLHYIKLAVKLEGESDILMDIKFDFEDYDVAQPPPFEVGQILSPSIFGTAVFGTSKFGTPEIPTKKVNVWGSGFSNSFRFYSNDTLDPYSIQGIYVDLFPSGRR